MAPIYVADSYALMALCTLVPASKRQAVMLELTDLVEDGRLLFPESVWRECCAYPDADGVAVWTRAVWRGGDIVKPSYTAEMEVLDVVPELLDTDTPESQTQSDVAAVAWSLLGSDDEVVVITEDRNERPDRMALEPACQELGITTVTLLEFIHAEVSVAIP